MQMTTRYLTNKARWSIIGLLVTAVIGGPNAAAAETLKLTCKATLKAADDKGNPKEFDVTRHFEIEDKRVLLDGGEWTKDATVGQQSITFTASVVPGAVLHKATINRITGEYEEHIIKVSNWENGDRWTGVCVKEEPKKPTF